MDRFEAMQRFMLVAQTSSFTRAAEMSGLPKSSISTAVQFLEKRLGARLLHRTTRRVSLTQDGEVYLRQCQALMAKLDAVESQFQYQNEAIRGILRVDMPSRFASAVIFPNLHEWLDTYPNTQLKISCSDQMIDLIEEAVDCVVRVGILNDSSLVARPLLNYQMVNCVSPAYLAKYGEAKELDDLRHHLLIDYAQTIGMRPSTFEYRENDEVKQIDMPSALTINNTDAYLAACLAGLGIAQIPRISVAEHIKQGALVPILANLTAAPMPVYLLYPSRRDIPKRLSLFMDWLAQLMKRLDAAC